jgi:hypothetical protein
MQTLNLEQLRAATLSGGVLAITLRADGASFVVDVQTQSGQATMVTSRQQPRRFVDPRKALQVLRALGWNACQIDVGQWRPQERAGQAVRPDRSDALKAAHQAAHQAEHQAAQANADYDRWFSTKVQTALEGLHDGRNAVLDAQQVQERRAALRTRLSGPA